MLEPPVRLGMMLYTLIEPHAGLHREYNRWYERDHFYSGVLTLPGTLAGQRWVATPELKRLRLPEDSPVVPDRDRGSFLTTYYVDADFLAEWDVAASAAAGRLREQDRLWPQRDHVLTRFFDYDHAVYRDDDPVPAVCTLDHRYPGLVTVVGQGAPGVSVDALQAWLREEFVPGAIAASPVASVLTWHFHPFEGDRPADLLLEVDPPTRFHQLWFVDTDPARVWTDVFVPLAAALGSSGMATLEWLGGFIPTVPGTDTHVELFER